MRKSFNFGSLPIKTITVFVSEINGQPIPLELSLNNLAKEVDNICGVCVLQPNKIYTALTDLVISKEDMYKISYEYIPNTVLIALCIKPNLFAIPLENNDYFRLAFSFTITQNIKVNINTLIFGDVVFEYDDNDIPYFIKTIKNKIEEMKNEANENYEKLKNNDTGFDVENDLKKLDEAIDRQNQISEEEKKMKELSSNSLIDIFDKAADDLMEDSEEIPVDMGVEE